jgi:hypothetical protein
VVDSGEKPWLLTTFLLSAIRLLPLNSSRAQGLTATLDIRLKLSTAFPQKLSKIGVVPWKRIHRMPVERT